MLVLFTLIFVADTKIIFGYNFVAPLNNTTFDLYKHLLQTTQTQTVPVLIVLRNLSIQLSSTLHFEFFRLSELLFLIGLEAYDCISICLYP